MGFANFFKINKGSKGNNDEHVADKSLITAIIILLFFGLVALFSASSVISYQNFGVTYHYAIKQFFYAILGVILFFLVSRIQYTWWKKFAVFFLFISIFMLILVYVPGIESDYGTANRWIKLFGFSFQPAELVKLSFLLYLATWMEVKKAHLASLTGGFIPFLAILAVIGALILSQPDTGSMFVIVASAMAAFFVGGGGMKHLIALGILGALMMYLLVGVGGGYKSDRFACLRDPGFSPDHKCYHINQALIAVGSGGVFGRGLGESRQKFAYLPEVWGDAIFPIIAEEMGFIFSTLLILLYLFIFYRGLLVAKNAPDLYSGALATGIVVWLAVQTFLNIGGMINLIPMTGLPLPLVSAGGSSLILTLIALGILVNISKYTKEYGRRR